MIYNSFYMIKCLKSQLAAMVMSGHCVICMGLQKVFQTTNAYMYGWFDLNHFSSAGSDLSG